MRLFKENEKLLGLSHHHVMADKTFLIVGLGGLGGFIANAMVRLGARNVLLVDPDRFEVSNLNRQLYSDQATLGKYKVDVVKDALHAIDETVHIQTYKETIQTLIETKTFKKIDAIFDAVDNIPTRLAIEAYATQLTVPLFHGALGGFMGQVSWVMPGSTLLETLYGAQTAGIEKTLGSPTFLPPIIANLMVLECIKWLHGLKPNLKDQLLVIDLLHHTYTIELDLRK